MTGISIEKCVMIVDEALPAGVQANTAAILGMTLGRLAPELVGPDAVDKSGVRHPGIVQLPVPILRTNGDRLRELRARLLEEEFADLLYVDFSDVAQCCNQYDEYLAKAAETAENDHRYFGLALGGSKKKVNRLTGNLPLLR